MPEVAPVILEAPQVEWPGIGFKEVVISVAKGPWAMVFRARGVDKYSTLSRANSWLLLTLYSIIYMLASCAHGVDCIDTEFDVVHKHPGSCTAFVHVIWELIDTWLSSACRRTRLRHESQV